MSVRSLSVIASLSLLFLFFAVVPTFAQQPLAGDFNGDQLLDCGDVDILSVEIRSGANAPAYDLDGDGFVDLTDLETWQGYAYEARGWSSFGRIIPDFNLDGAFNHADANILGINAHGGPVTSWCQGDQNLDGDIDATDL